ncbi:MAG: hypothetical protein WC911_09585 [Thermoleophilia bacterium]
MGRRLHAAVSQSPDELLAALCAELLEQAFGIDDFPQLFDSAIADVGEKGLVYPETSALSRNAPIGSIHRARYHTPGCHDRAIRYDFYELVVNIRHGCPGSTPGIFFVLETDGREACWRMDDYVVM